MMPLKAQVFVSGAQAHIAGRAGLPLDDVIIEDVRPGSIIVKSRLLFPANQPLDALDAFCLRVNGESDTMAAGMSSGFSALAGAVEGATCSNPNIGKSLHHFLITDAYIF